MGTLLTIVLYASICFSIMQNWLLFAGLCIIMFSIRYGAITLIPLAIVLDGYYGNYHTVPYLSFITVWWYAVVEYVRPKILGPDMIKV